MKAALNGAAKNGHLDVVKWLHDNRTEGCTTAAMDGAVENGHLDVVCWLHDYRTQGCTGNAIKWAAGNGHLAVVEWLYKVYGSQFSIPDPMNSAALAARGGHLKIVQMLAMNCWFSHPKYLTPVMANVFMYGNISVVEWLLGRGYQVRAKDTQWAQDAWNKRTGKSETMNIFFKRAEVSVPDARRTIVFRGDLRMIRWWHGCKSYTSDHFQAAAWNSKVVLTRWLLENGVQLDREAIWDNFWTFDRVEVMEWVPESDRVWVVEKALAEEEEDFEKVLWVLENAEFLDVNSRIIIRNAIHQASHDSLQWMEVQTPEVRNWYFGDERQTRPVKRQRTN